MNSTTSSITAALKDLKSRALSEDAYLTEMTKLADLDQHLDPLDRAERIFTLRERITKLQQRIRELEGHK